MDNGMKEQVIAQFDKIAELPDYWDHNQQYQDYLLNHVGNKRKKGLDIGCGTGELTKKLQKYCDHITGIDISSKMIDEARTRNSAGNIEYINADIETYLSKDDILFDLVISIATFHHLDMQKILGLIKTKMESGGILLILDLYKAKTLYEHILSFLATICNPIVYLIKRGRISNTKEEKEAWKDHAQYDHYSSMKEIHAMSQKALGNVVIRRHLFWRYSLIYVKE